MAFRIRDLMVNVIPQGTGRVAIGIGGTGGGGGVGCRVISCLDSQNCVDGSFDYYTDCYDVSLQTGCAFETANTCVYTCDTTAPICNPYSCFNYTCPPGTNPPPCHPWYASMRPQRAPNLVYYPRAALKEQLRTALAEVEAREKAAEEASRPRNREEAEELEEKLRGALEEVRGWQETLPSGGSK
jgi:hypothetical protein